MVDKKIWFLKFYEYHILHNHVETGFEIQT